MNSELTQKYAQLKAAAAESADMVLIDDLMIDILHLLHQQFQAGEGRQKQACEHAYYQLDCTLTAHRSTKEDIKNCFYLSEISLQVGLDIETALSHFN